MTNSNDLTSKMNLHMQEYFAVKKVLSNDDSYLGMSEGEIDTAIAFLKSEMFRYEFLFLTTLLEVTKEAGLDTAHLEAVMCNHDMRYYFMGRMEEKYAEVL